MILGAATPDVKCKDVKDEMHGGTEKWIEEIFTQARAAPTLAIVFMDEFDALASKPEGGKGSWAMQASLNALKVAPPRNRQPLPQRWVLLPTRNALLAPPLAAKYYCCCCCCSLRCRYAARRLALMRGLALSRHRFCLA